MKQCSKQYFIDDYCSRRTPDADAKYANGGVDEPISVQATKQASKEVSESASEGDARTVHNERTTATLLIILQDITVVLIVKG